MGGRDVVADLKYIKRVQGTDIPGALVITSALQHYYTPIWSLVKISAIPQILTF